VSERATLSPRELTKTVGSARRRLKRSRTWRDDLAFCQRTDHVGPIGYDARADAGDHRRAVGRAGVINDGDQVAIEDVGQYLSPQP